MEKKIPHKIYISESEMPKAWFNIKACMKEQHEPFINPKTMKPCTEDDLRPVFCDEVIKQELNTTDELIPIPQGIQDLYHMYRPSPLCRAFFLEKSLGTPAKIYYKFEGNNTSGSHKLNSAMAQVYYAKEQGITSLTTETGAGQWGTALSMACGYFGLDLTVYMVRCSYEQKPQRKTLMTTYGANVIPSPSDTTEVGKRMLREFPNNTSGSLGTAISEAVEVAVKSGGARKYALGSVLNQVMLHQSVIGIESKRAMEKIDEYPDIIIGCAGGGSNLGGLISEFMRDKLKGKANPYVIAVEPMSCPSLTKGVFAYDYCDTGRVTPLAMMYTLGSGFCPSPSHAGGLRYHGMSPILSQLYCDGYIDEARAVNQVDVFDAATKFARVEGILPAPESAHAIKAAIDEAVKCKESGESKTILFGLTGTGYFDLYAYEKFLNGTLSDAPPSEAELARSENAIPKF